MATTFRSVTLDLNAIPYGTPKTHDVSRMPLGSIEPFRMVLKGCGNQFSHEIGNGHLLEFQTTTPGAAIAWFYMGLNLETVVALLSGESTEAEAVTLPIFSQAVDAIAHMAGKEFHLPFSRLPLRERPLAIIVPVGTRPLAPAAAYLSKTVAGAFFIDRGVINSRVPSGSLAHSHREQARTEKPSAGRDLSC